jgi:uncharacterized membrane protein YkgB
MDRNENIPNWIESSGSVVMQYGLAVIFLWFGAMKFTDYEAQGIAPFVANSPLVGWWHSLLGVSGTSQMLGMIEITAGILLLLRPISPVLSAIGGAIGVLTFSTTLTFFLTTPGVAEPSAGGFPAISAPIGQFLLKDVGLLGISLWVLGSSWRRAAVRVRPILAAQI